MRYHEIVNQRRPPNFRPLHRVSFELGTPDGDECATFECGLVAGEAKLGHFYAQVERGEEAYIAIHRDGLCEALDELARALSIAGMTVPITHLRNEIALRPEDVTGSVPTKVD